VIPSVDQRGLEFCACCRDAIDFRIRDHGSLLYGHRDNAAVRESYPGPAGDRIVVSSDNDAARPRLIVQATRSFGLGKRVIPLICPPKAAAFGQVPLHSLCQFVNYPSSGAILRRDDAHQTDIGIKEGEGDPNDPSATVVSKRSVWRAMITRISPHPGRSARNGDDRDRAHR
jgi:hypothetical protein